MTRKPTLLVSMTLVFACARGVAAQQPEPSQESAKPVPIRLVFIETGKRIEAVLISTSADTVEVEIGGVRQWFARADVQYELVRPIDQQADDILANLDENDVVNRLMVAEWLIQNGLFEKAGEVVRDILAIEPGNPDAVHFDRLVRAQLALNQQSNAPKADPVTPAKNAQTEDEFPLLTPEQIALVKVYEYKKEDRLAVSIKPEVVERFFEAYADNPRVPASEDARKALVARGPAAVLDLMYDVRARDFYQFVEIAGVPDAMLNFRDRINSTWLANSCASVDCHGGESAGRLRLTKRQTKSESAYFTNYYVLDRFRLPDGTPLINYNDPPASPLLQLGLPRDISSNPHKEVPGASGRGDGWRATFRNDRDPKFKQAVSWIESMFRPRPEYELEYPPKREQPSPR